MPLPQNPPAKGTPDFFDMMHKAEDSGLQLRSPEGTFTPTSMVRGATGVLDSAERLDHALPAFGEQEATWKKYQFSPKYGGDGIEKPGDRAKFDVDYALAKTAHAVMSEAPTVLKASNLYSYGATPRTVMENVGTVQSDNYNLASLFGNIEGAGWHKPEVMTAWANQSYTDYRGQQIRIGGEDFVGQKRFVLDANMGPHGTIVGPAQIREQKEGESPYDSRIFGGSGLGKFDSNDFVEFGSSFGSAMFPATKKLFHEIGAMRIKAVNDIASVFGKANNPAVVERAFKGGGLTSYWDNPYLASLIKGGTPEDDIKHAMGLAASMENDSVHDAYEEYLKDPAKVHDLANKGDARADALLRNAQLVEGSDGDKYKLLMNMQHDLISGSMADTYQRTFTSDNEIDGHVANALGDGAAQLVQQMLLSWGVGGALSALGKAAGGASWFTKMNHVLQAGQPSAKIGLTRAGRILSVGTGSLLPAAQVGSSSYEEARLAGYDHDDAANFGLFNAAIMFATENVIGTPYMVKSWAFDGAKASREAIKSELPNLKEAISVGRFAASRKIMAKVFDAVKNNAAKVDEQYGRHWTVDKAINVTKGYLSEGSQEGLEALGNYAMKRAYDSGALGNGSGNFNSGETDLWKDVKNSFVIGGVLGGAAGLTVGKRIRQGKTKSIMEAVVNGHSEDMRAEISSRESSGSITEAEAMDARAEVDFAERVKSMWNYEDPHVYVAEKADRSFVRQGVHLRAEEERLKTAFAEAQQKLQSAPAEEKAQLPVIQENVASLESELGAVQQKLTEFRSGKHTLSALQDFQIWSSIRSGKLMKGTDVGVNAETVNAFLGTGEQSFIGEAMRLSEELTLKRTEMDTDVQQLNKAIQSLATGVTPENKIDSLVDGLRKESALRRDDLEGLNNSIATLKSNTYKELGLSEKEQENVEEAIAVGAIVPEVSSEKEMAAFEKLQLIGELKSTSLNPMLQPRDGDPVTAALEHMFSTVRAPGQSDVTERVHIQDLLDQISNLSELTEEQNAAYGSSLIEAAQQATVFEVLKTAYPELAQKMTERETAMLQKQPQGWNGKLPELLAKFKQDNETLFSKMKNADMGDFIFTLQKANMELMRRTVSSTQKLDNIRALQTTNLDMRISASLLMVSSGVLGNEFADSVRQPIEAAIKAKRDGSLKDLQRILVGIERAISKAMVAQKDTAATASSFVEWYKKQHDISGSASHYLAVTDWLNANPSDGGGYFFVKEYAPELLSRKHGSKQGVSFLTSWLVQVSADRDVVDDAYYAKDETGAIVQEQPLTWEQEQAARTLISAILYRDHAFNAGIVSAMMGGNRSGSLVRNGFTIPGSAGVGKTFLLPRVIAAAYRAGSVDKVLFVASGDKNTMDVASRFPMKGVLDTAIMNDVVSGKQTLDGYDMVIFDEAHGLTGEDFAGLREKLAHVDSSFGSQFRLFLGDQSQSPVLNTASQPFPVLTQTLHVDPIMTSLRQGNMPLMEFVDTLRSATSARGMAASEAFSNLRTIWSPNEKRGVRVIKTTALQPVLDEFASHVVRYGIHGSSMVVVDEDARNEALSYLRNEHPEVFAKSGDDEVGAAVQTMTTGAFSALGTTTSQVFAFIPENTLYYAKVLYTAASRATDLLTIGLPNGNSKPEARVVDSRLNQSVINGIRSDYETRQLTASEGRVAEAKPADPDATIAVETEPTVPDATSPIATAAVVAQEKMDDGDESVPQPVYEWGSSSSTGKSPSEAGGKPGFLAEHAVRTNRMWFHMNSYVPHIDGKVDYAGGVNIRKAVMGAMLFPATIELVVRRNAAFINKDGIKEGNDMIVVRLAGQASDYTELPDGADPEASRIIGMLPMSNKIKGDLESLVEPIYHAAANAVDGEVIGTYQLDAPSDGDATFRAQWSENNGESIPYGSFVSQVQEAGGVVAEGELVDVPFEDGTSASVPAIRVRSMPYGNEGGWRHIFLDPARATKEDIERMRTQLIADGSIGEGSEVKEFLRQNTAQVLRDPSLNALASFGNTFDLTGKAKLDFAASDTRSAYQTAKEFLDLMEEFALGQDPKKRPWLPYMVEPITKRIAESSLKQMNVVNRSPILGPPFPFFKLQSEQQSSVVGDQGGNPFDMTPPEYSSTVMGNATLRDTIQEAINEAERLLGKRFLNGGLEFRPNLQSLNKEDVSGLMKSGRILARVFEDGKVRRGVIRHEAMHYVLDYLLDPVSRGDIMRDAALEMYQRGERYPTERQIHEYLAERFEQKQQPTNLVGRFLAWLKAVARRLAGAESRIDRLMRRLDAGRFANTPALQGTGQEEYASSMPMDAGSEEQLEDMSLEDEDLDRNAVGMNKLYQRLGHYYAVRPIRKIQTELMFRTFLAPVENTLEGLTTRKLNYGQAIEAIYEGYKATVATHRSRFVPDPNSKTIALRDGRTTSYNALLSADIRHIVDAQQFIADVWIMDQMSRDRDLYNTVVAVAFPGIRKWSSVVSDISSEKENAWARDNDRINPTSMMTGPTQVFMQNIPLLTTKVIDGKINVVQEGVKRLSRHAAERVLMDALGVVRTRIGMSPTFTQGVDKNGNPVFKGFSLETLSAELKKEMRSIMEKGNMQSNAARSLYHVLFHGGYSLEKSNIVYDGYFDATVRAQKELTENRSLSQEQQQIIQERSLEVETFLNGLFSQFISRTPYNAVRTEARDHFVESYGRMERGRPQLRAHRTSFYGTMTGAQDIKNELRSRWGGTAGIDEKRAALFNIGTESPNEIGKELIGDDAGRYLIGASGDFWGIRERAGKNNYTWFLKVPYRNGKIEMLSAKLNHPSVTDPRFGEWVGKLASLLHDGYGISGKGPGEGLYAHVIEAIIRSNDQNNTELLIDVIAGYGAAIKDSIYAWYRRDEGTVEPVPEVDRKTGVFSLSGYRRIAYDPQNANQAINDLGADKETVNDAQESWDDEQNGQKPTGRRQPIITDAFSLAERLDSFFALNGGKQMNRQFKAGSGEMHMLDALGSPIRDAFPAIGERLSKEQPEAYSKGTREYMDAYGLYYESAGQRIYPIPFADKDLKQRLFVYKGIEMNQQKGSTTYKMNPADAATLQVDEFARSIMLNDQARSEYVIPAGFSGGRDQINFIHLNKTPFRTNGQHAVYATNSSGGKTAVFIDRDHLSERVEQMLLLYRDRLDRGSAMVRQLLGDQAEAFLRGAKKFEQGSPEFRAILNSGLVHGAAYVIDGNNIKAGSMFVGNESSLVSGKMLGQLFGMSVQARRDAIKQWMAERGQWALHNMNKVSPNWTLPPSYNRRGEEGHAEQFKPGLMEAATWLHWLADQWTSAFTVGLDTNFKSEADRAKRMKLQGSSGMMGIPSRNGMPTMLNYAYFLDQDINGVPAHDGSSFKMPWTHIMEQVSFGGKTSIVGESSAKPIEVTPVYSKKDSEARISAQSYLMSPLHRNLIARSLGHIDLLTAWSDIMIPAIKPNEKGRVDLAGLEKSFNQATQKILQMRNQPVLNELGEESGTYEQFIGHVAVPNSAAKSGFTRGNMLDEDTPFLLTQRPASAKRMQLNPERDASNNQVSAPAQLIQQIGIASNGQAYYRRIADIQASMTTVFRKDFEKQFQGDSGTPEYALIRNKMIELGKRQVAFSSFMGNMLDLVNDKAISINNPMVSTQMMRAMEAWVQKEGLVRRMKGNLFVSTSGWGYRISDAKAEGGVREMLKNEVLLPFSHIKHFIPEEKQADAQYMSLEEVRELIEERATKLGGKGVDLLVAFEKALTVVVQRTPLTLSSGARVCKVAGFLSDQSNTIVVHPDLSRMAGADYDVDQWTVYMNHFEGNAFDEVDPLRTENESNSPWQVEQNRIFETIVEYYANNPAGADLLTGTASLEAADKELEAEELAEQAANPLPKFRFVSSDFGSHIMNHARFFNGKKLTGPAALSIKGYSYLVKAAMTNPDVFKGNAFALSNGLAVIDDLSGVLNGAVDDEKLLILGKRGVTVDNLPILIGAIMAPGGSLKKALKIISSLEIQNITAQYLATRRIIDRQKGDRISFFKMLQGFEPVAQLDESGNAIKNEQGGYVMVEPSVNMGEVLQYYNMGNAMNGLVRSALTYNTNAIPIETINERLLETETMLGQSLDDFLDGKAVIDANAYRKNVIGPKIFSKLDGDYATARLDEEAARWAFFDSAELLRQLPEVMSWMRLLRSTRDVAQAGFVQLNPAVENAFATLAHKLGYNRFPAKTRTRIAALFQENMIATILHGAMSPFKMGEKYYDLSMATDREAFAVDFALMYSDATRAASVSRSKAEMMHRNKWVQNISFGQREGRRPQLADRTLLADPVFKSESLAGFYALDEIFSDFPSEQKMTELLSLYALVSEGFANSKASLMPAIGMTAALTSINRQLDLLGASLSKSGDYTVTNPVTGQSVSLMTDGMNAVLKAAVRSNLVQRATPISLSKLEKTDAYHSQRLEDGTVLYKKGNIQLITLGTNQTIAIDPTLDSYANKLPTDVNPVKKNWSESFKRAFHSGKATFRESVDDSSGFTKGPLRTQFGTMQILQVQKGRITVDTSGATKGVAHNLFGYNADNTQKLLEFLDKDQPAVSAAVRLEITSDQPNAQRLLDALALNSSIGDLVQAVLEFYVRTGRTLPTLRFEPNSSRPGSVGHFNFKRNEIVLTVNQLDQSSTSLQDVVFANTAMTFLHEIIHATSYGSAIDSRVGRKDETLTQSETRFRKEVSLIANDIRREVFATQEGQQALRDAGISSKIEAYISASDEEILAYSQSDPGFFGVLKQFSSGKRSFMQRIWDAIRRLLGMSPQQRDFMSRMNEVYMGFLRTANVTQNPQVFYGKQLAYQMADIVDMSDLGEALRSTVPGSKGAKSSSAETVEREWRKRIDEGWERILQDGFVDFGEGMRFNVDGNTAKEAAHQFVRETVVPFYAGSGREKLIEKLVLSLSSINGIEAGFVANFSKKDKKETRIDVAVIESLQQNMDVREGDFVGDLHTIRSGSGVFTNRLGASLSVSEMGVSIPEGFGAMNMLVKIRKHGDRNTISVFDVNASGLMANAYGVATEKLFSSMSTGLVGRALNAVNFTNREHDIRRLQLMGLAMAIRRSSPLVVLGDLLVVQFGATKFDRYSVDPSDAVFALEALRTTPAWNLLPNSVKTVLSDESLKQNKLHVNEDVLNYFDFLESRSSVERDLKTFPAGQREQVGELYQAWQTLPTLQQHIKGLRTDPEAMITAIRERIAFLGRLVGKVSASMDELIKSELDVASRALISAKALTFTNPEMNTKKETIGGRMFKPTYNLKNSVVQMVQTAIRDADSRITHWTKKFQNEHALRINALKAGLRTQAPDMFREAMQIASNKGIDIFKPLFRRSSKDKGSRYAVFDDAGELVDADIRVLHWNKNDPETAALLASGKLVAAHLEYSNWLLDQLDAYYRKVFRHEIVSAAPFMATKENETALASAIDKRMENAVPYRGALPVTHADAGEKAFSKEVIKDEFRNMAGNLDLMPKELRASDLLANSNAVVDFELMTVNQFLADVSFGERSGSSLGHPRRLSRMGLNVNGSGTPVLFNKASNEALSNDLEMMAKLFVMSVEAKITHELYTLPIAYSGRSMLKGLAQKTGSDQKQNIQLIERNINRLVHIRNTDDTERLEGLNLNVNAAIHSMTHLTTMTRLSLNLPVAIASMTTNLLNGWSRALASDLSGQGYFGTKELNWALGVVLMKGQIAHSAEREKMMALMHRYFVYDMGRTDLLYNNQHSEVRKRPGANEMHFMNRWTDINMRIAVMAAQMKKDGSWEAYSLNKDGDLVYDEKKDNRFYDGGKLKEGMGTVIKRIKQSHAAEGLYEQAEDAPLVTGYDQASANVFKWLSDKYIIGGMDATVQPNMDTYMLLRLGTQFRKYLPDKIHNWWANRMESEFGGKWVPVKDASGNYAEAKWEKAVTVGHLHAMLEFIQTIGTTRKIDPATRASLAMGAYDFLVFMAINMLVIGLWDDDDKKMLQNPVIRRLRMSAEDLVIGSPLFLAETINKEPAPALSMAQGWINLLMGDTSELSKNIPGVSSYKFITGLAPEQPSKTN